MNRCTSVEWLQPAAAESPTNGNGSRQSPVEQPAMGQKEYARRALGMTVQGGNESSTSVLEIAGHTAQPGVQTPSMTKHAR